MSRPYSPAREPLTIMADGTIKQLHPFSGTEVWTVPGRGNRPLSTTAPDTAPLRDDARRACAFCEERYLETPPEKARLVRDASTGTGWRTVPRLASESLHESVAEFRRIPNLFEIVSYDYWRANYRYEPARVAVDHHEATLRSTAGREHVLEVLRARHLAAAGTQDEWDALDEEGRLTGSLGFFAGGHDVIVARRHYVDGAESTDQLASSGTLTPEEHAAYVDFTVEAMEALYADNRYARYVATFQNWLRPAGASFDHLHKQLVAIDDHGVQIGIERGRLRTEPNMYNEWAADYAARRDLLLLDNAHAVAFAGFGHRYPTLEVYSKSPSGRPFEQTSAQRRGMSDLVHALHAAAGPGIACNEEWQHQPIDVVEPMPWRIQLKWRVSTLAGFEGGTRVYLNTIDPWTLRDRILPRLHELRDAGALATGLSIGSECAGRPNSLRYGRG